MPLIAIKTKPQGLAFLSTSEQKPQKRDNCDEVVETIA